MFQDYSDDCKYEYKDIRLILGYTSISGEVLRVEVQLILHDILLLKKVQNQIVDIIKTDSELIRFNLLKLLCTSIIKKKNVKWDRSEPM